MARFREVTAKEAGLAESASAEEEEEEEEEEARMGVRPGVDLGAGGVVVEAASLEKRELEGGKRPGKK